MAYVTVDVDVDLDDFDDDEIRKEYEARGLGDGPSEGEEMETLKRIHQLMRFNKREQAYNLMYDYIRDKLGVAV